MSDLPGDEPQTTGDPEISALLGRVIARLEAAKIKYKNDSEPDYDDVTLYVFMPCGKETRSIFLLDKLDLQQFESLQFENYTLLGSYAAIFSYSEKTIEAVLTAPASGGRPFIQSRVHRQLGVAVKGGVSKLSLTLPLGSDLEEVSISPISKEAKVLTQASDALGLSLLIRSPDISSHDEAVELLQKISNALFFEIDLRMHVHVRILRRQFRERISRGSSGEKAEFPKNMYDSDPMALYWYARSATGMPLLQFLAYYQVIEFYYPIYFNAEVSRRVRSIIKNPSFKIENDSDITRVVTAIRSNGAGFASEKDQLKATIRECLQSNEIQEFLSENKDCAEFFSAKQKGISQYLLNPQNRAHDLCDQTADRIYDIRCKIVHTKGNDGSEGVELLLPYSREAEMLGHDIEFLRFICQKVLVYSSRTFA
jgi:hypothetical protein